jgi:pimeloyl-ACP methyl ester carboxylesterase
LAALDAGPAGRTFNRRPTMPDLLLLHAALGARSQFDALAAELGDDYRLHSIDFEGHGAEPPSDRPFRIESFAENVAAYLDREGLAGVDIFGYSMGGYVALHLASTEPERVGRVFTFGTKLRWDPDTAAREVRMLDPGKIREKVPHFAAALQARHSGAGWESVLEKTAEMMLALGESSPLGDDEFAAIAHRVRLSVGDRDATVGPEETAGVYRLMPNAELQVFPSTPHPFERVSMPMIAGAVRAFFTGKEKPPSH